MCASRKCLFERKLLRNEWKRKWCKNWHRVSHVWYRSPLFLKKKSMTSKNPCILSFRATRPSRHRSFLLFCFFSGIPSLINGIQFCVHAVHMMIGEQQQQKKKIKTNEIQIIIAPISAKHLKFIGSNHSGFFSIYTLHCVWYTDNFKFNVKWNDWKTRNWKLCVILELNIFWLILRRGKKYIHIRWLNLMRSYRIRRKKKKLL